MNRIVSLSIHFIFCLCILGMYKTSIDINNIEFHLGAYSEVNRTHHDNIDDNTQGYIHIHRHSENGEEHEHNHGHSKIAQYEMKILGQVNHIQMIVRDYQVIQIFFEKNLISNSHLLKLFKPPIS